MLMIRLSRCGSKRKPVYRVVVIDKRKARDAQAKEYLGYLNPITDVCKVNFVRIDNLIKKGAQLSNRVSILLRTLT